MFMSIQILRAAAALLVLAYHTQHEVVNRLGFEGPTLLFGAAGVDIFFVISGFIMVWSTRSLRGQPGAAGLFLRRRLVRIVPLYWLTTLLFLVGVLIWPPQNFGPLDPANLLASLLFIPWPNQAGLHAPFYGLGWTLNFEMLFYVLFALGLRVAGQRVVPAVTVLLLGLVGLGWLVPGLPFPLQVWTDPLVLEFLAGAWIAVARLQGATLPAALRAGMIVAGFGLLIGTEWLSGFLPWRVVAWGAPAALIIAGAVLGPDWAVRGIAARVAVLLGDASYSIYLVHFLALSAVRRVAGRFVEIATVSPLAYGLAAALIAIVASILVHLAFEKPAHRWLLARLGLGGRAVGQHRPV